MIGPGKPGEHQQHEQGCHQWRRDTNKDEALPPFALPSTLLVAGIGGILHHARTVGNLPAIGVGLRESFKSERIADTVVILR